MNQRERIAVAGATGRLGRHIVDALEGGPAFEQSLESEARS